MSTLHYAFIVLWLIGGIDQLLVYSYLYRRERSDRTRAGVFFTELSVLLFWPFLSVGGWIWALVDLIRVRRAKKLLLLLPLLVLPACAHNEIYEPDPRCFEFQRHIDPDTGLVSASIRTVPCNKDQLRMAARTD